MVITVGLLGNPNVGKTSLFNRLVGARQYVANWPGVTVSRIEGATTYEGYTLHFVDLPGVYTLTATSIDEKVTRDYLLFSPPNVTVVIIDSMSPEQGLFLLLEALELELNVVAVFNAIDEARKGGYKIDKAVLETFLRVPVILTSAHTGEGIDELKQKIVSAFKKPTRPLLIDYGKEVEERISEVEKCVMEGFNKRFTAIKVIEGDKFVSEFLSKDCQKQGQSEELQSSNMNSNPEKSDDSLATKIPSIKYEYINDVLQKAFQKTDSALTVTEALDHVLTH
ncbi:MAG: FeoB small GTPase domain-containing protein, partial [Fervidobacterium gondwanense]